jgi:hypothetical protein
MARSPRACAASGALPVLIFVLLGVKLSFGQFADEPPGECPLLGLVGYTIIASKSIEGYRGPGREKDDSFEGCDDDRIIIFTDGTALRCAAYGHQYAYRPTAIIFGRRMEFHGRSLTLLKMLVEDAVYDMSALR